MTVMAVFLVVAVAGGRHPVPARAHAYRKGSLTGAHKLQFEIVAVLGLLALFTHMHIFWVIGLLLALIDLPGLRSLSTGWLGSLENIAGIRRAKDADDGHDESLSPQALQLEETPD